jgi:hypothetical protein
MFHRVSDEKGWTHNEMMGMPKAVFHRYFNYIVQDRKDEEEANKEQQEKMERERELQQRRQRRENTLQEQGKL